MFNKKSIIFFILCFVTLICSSCTKFKIDNEELKDDLQKGLQWRPLRDSMKASQVMMVSSCKAVEGHSPTDEEYVITFEGTLKAIQTFYCSRYYRGFFSVIPDWAKEKKQFWEKISKGTTLYSTGNVYYKKHESGWKLKKFDAPILNDKKEIAKFRVYRFKLKDKIDMNMD